jgi:WD40 repeat protein
MKGPVDTLDTTLPVTGIEFSGDVLFTASVDNSIKVWSHLDDILKFIYDGGDLRNG